MSFKLALIAVLMVSYGYAAVNYTVETRNVTTKPGGSGDQYATNLINTFNAAGQPSGYCTKTNPNFPLNNQSMCTGSNKNIGWKITFNFSDNEDANYQIEFGTDFGWGSAIIVDGATQVTRTDDMWWAGNWGSGAVFKLDYNFAKGEHRVEIYGAEGCCDGKMDIRLSRNSGSWIGFNQASIDNQIPEYVPEEQPVDEITPVPSTKQSITVETFQVTAKPAGAGAEYATNLVNTVESAPQPDGYCSKENPKFPLSNQSMCSGGNNKIGWRITFNFSDPEDANYQIEFGTDFGWGSAIYVDGDLNTVRTDDMWWAGNWNSNAVFRLNYDFTAGDHSVVIYGAEGCCDGAMDVRIRRNSGDWNDFDIDIIDEIIPTETEGDDDEDRGDCVILFSECDYQGESIDICTKECDIKGFTVKSVYVPAGKTASFYGGSCGEGERIKVTESLSCIGKFSFKQFLSHDTIVMSEVRNHHKKNLRNHKNHQKHHGHSFIDNC